MVNFGGRLKAAKWKPWSRAYFDYDGLKKILAHAVVKNERRVSCEAVAASLPSSGGASPLGTSDDDDFIRALDKEVEKVVLFFLATQGDVATRLLDLRVKMRGLSLTRDSDDQQPSQPPPSTPSLKSAVTDVLSSAVLTAPPHAGIVAKKPSSLDPDGAALTTVDAATIAALYKSLCEDLVRLLRFVEVNAEGVKKILKKHDKLMTRKRITGLHYLSTRVNRNADSHLRQLYYHNGLSAICSSLKAAVSEMGDAEGLLGDSVPTMQKSLQTVQEARAQMQRKNATTLSQFLSLKPLIFDREELERGLLIAQLEEAKGVSVALEIAAWLNIGSVFFTAANYYCSMPTTQAYADALHVDLSYSGIILGMAPVAQVFSAFLFSYLSNYAFKAPILLSSALQLLGNLLYALAIVFNSMPMLLAGRFLGGAGSAEAINRRFIADCIPPQQRTSASIAFVSAAAIGMASGPALAAALFSVDFKLGPLIFNPATAPSYVMAIIWALYILAVLCLFQEPSRQPVKLPYDGGSGHHTTAATITTSPTREDGSRGGLVLHRRHSQSRQEDERASLLSPVGDTAINDDTTTTTTTTTYGSSTTTTSPPIITGQLNIVTVPNDAPDHDDGDDGDGDHHHHHPPHFDLIPSAYSSGVSEDGHPLTGSSAVSSNLGRSHGGGDDDDEDTALYRKIQHGGDKPQLLTMVLRNRPLMITLGVYFLIELADEILLSSAGLIAAQYFDWGVLQTGSFLAILGILVMPANYLISEAAGPLEDRTILIASELVTIAGLLTILSYWGWYSEYQFLSGTVLIFVSVAVMEGVDTSLMSKVIPPVLSRGTFNSGLLAVQVGTVAKALGDGMITVIGLNATELVDGLYFPLLIITIGLLLISVKYFDDMN